MHLKHLMHFQLTESENATESEREPMLNEGTPPVPTPSSPPPSYTPSTSNYESPSGNIVLY